MGILGDLDPLDWIMGLATIFGTYIAYKGYQLSEKEFKLNCVELGISTKEAIQRAWESYQTFENDSLQEKNEMIQDANQMLSNDMDTMNQMMEKIYNNYGINKSESQQWNSAIHDADSLESMDYALATADKYSRDLNANTMEINDYTHYTSLMNKLKNANLKKIVKNTAKELANTTKQVGEAKKVVKESIKERKKVEKVINGKTKTSRPVIGWAHF